MKKTIRDTFLLGKNELLIQLRNPLWLFFGLFQPIVYLIFFSPFLKGVSAAPGFPQENAIQFFAPGLLIMNVLFGSTFAGFGLIDQLRSGFIERIRVTPVSRVSLALGFVFRSPLVLLVQSSLLLIVAAIFFGLQIHLASLLLLALLLIIVGTTMAALSYAIALWVREEGALAATTNFFTLPLFILSGVMLPVTFAPPLIQKLSHLDPFAYAVNAARALVNGIYDPSVGWAFLIFIALGTVTLSWFIRSMKEAVA